MAAWRYEISLRVLKNISRVFQHEKRNFVSPSGHVMFYLLYKHQWNAKPFYPAKGAIYYVAIATVIFSHVKIPSFCTKAHLVFHWCLFNKLYCSISGAKDIVRHIEVRYSGSTVMIDFQKFNQYHLWSLSWHV